MGFGNKLKEILKKKGITIKELSIMSGISLNTLYSITKRDTQAPDKEIVAKIAEVLEINESDLYTYDMFHSEIAKLIALQKKSEEDFRKKLADISLMLNSDALGVLLEKALDLIKYEACWSFFYDQKEIKNFVGDNIIPIDNSTDNPAAQTSDKL